MHRKIAYSIVVIILGGLLLSACNLGASTPEPTATMSFEQMSTSIAGTIIADFTKNAPTATNTPTITSTPTFTPTSQLPTNTAPRPTAATCSNAKYIDDISIPDGTQMPAGTTFTKTWRVENNGTCQWTTAYAIAFSYGEAMGGKTTSIPQVVPVGGQIDLSVDMKVPSKTGKLVGVWTLLDDKGQPFGELLTVEITVGTLTPASTGTPTSTPTATATP